MLDKLSAPFPPEAIHWRAQTLTQDKAKALALAYIDARDVMDRLDAAAGPANWATTYEETLKGRIFCRLSIRIEGEWVMKTDGAGDTDVEGEKGAISDALKRAAVSWGIGRYLYDLKDVWAPCELGQNGKWRKWAPAADAVFAKALAGVSRPTGPLNDKTRDWLTAQIDASGQSVQEFLHSFTPLSLKAITYEQLPEAQEWLRKHKKAA